MGRKLESKAGSSRDKGRVVERIVAAMHENPDVVITQNVFMPALGSRRRKREVDVLVTGSVAGYPIRIAIECKNERGKVGAPAIDAFVGKLKDVGIPPQCGIYVSANGYTSGAVERAAAEGIRTLVLTGLTDERFASEIAAAVQSIIFLMLDVTSMRAQNDIEASTEPWQMLVFYDQTGRPVSSLPDLVWEQWIDGALPEALGEHELELDIPEDWFTVVDGEPHPVGAISATVRVVGVVITIPGRFEQHTLVDASDGSVTRLRAHAEFERDSGSYVVHTLTSEQELEAATAGSQALSVRTSRMRLPRIRLSSMYWPVSERVAEEVGGKIEAFLAGKVPDPRPLSFEDVEGTDLATVWEPIWSGHPSMRGVQGDG